MMFRSAGRRRSAIGISAIGILIAAAFTIAYVATDETRDQALRAAPIPASLNANTEPAQNLGSLDDAIAFARTRLEHVRRVTDYTAVFTKTEFVNERLISQTMDLKFRQQPFSVYVRSHSKRQPAREAIFVAGRNDDRLILHEPGIKALITLNLKTDDPRVMAENRYPITDIGMTRMLDAAVAIWEQEKRIAPANVEVLYTRSGNNGSNGSDDLRITHRQQLTGLKFHVTRISFDIATSYPVLLEQYGWPPQPGELPPLVEQYRYTEIKTNSGLTDADFDPDNSEYHFGKMFP